jgi:hypothetical protein
MVGDLGRVVIDKVSYSVMRDAAEFGPGAKRADRRFFAGGKYSTLAQADNIRELTSKKR